AVRARRRAGAGAAAGSDAAARSCARSRAGALAGARSRAGGPAAGEAQVIRIATRKSALALWQAERVKSLLEERGTSCSLVPMTTQGDRILDRPLAEVGGKGLFVKELEQAMLEGRADIAVHSAKDVPFALPQRLVLT